MTQAIALNPKQPLIYFHRGFTYKKLNEKKKAADDLNTYLKLLGKTSGDDANKVRKLVNALAAGYGDDANKVRELIQELGYTPLY